MSLLDPRVWLAVMALCLASYGAGRFQQWRADDRAGKAVALAATQDAREREAAARKSEREIADAQLANLRRINARLAADLDGLRNRPDRLPDTERAACTGTSGAELSGPDAGFLVREAARADAVLAALRACEARERGQYDALMLR
ncbi:hypothetical protein [Caldimonas sp. KR1-144]|uniref:hypothetical protein n=1 Tax=Caldimonas sp. KR1-144 TaxID=3400911 RepID=UPI003C043C67